MNDEIFPAIIVYSVNTDHFLRSMHGTDTFSYRWYAMFTFNAILLEIKNMPSKRLDELYDFVHSLNPKIKKSDTQRKKILAPAGIFSDISKKNYSDFMVETKRIRSTLFDRDFE